MNKSELQKFAYLERMQQQTLFYVRALAESLHPGKKILPEVWLDDVDLENRFHWSRRTRERRRADKSLPHKKIKRKCYYREEDVLRLIAEGLA